MSKTGWGQTLSLIRRRFRKNKNYKEKKTVNVTKYGPKVTLKLIKTVLEITVYWLQHSKLSTGTLIIG